MSALILLYTLDQIYQRYNPERKKGDFIVDVKIDQETFQLNCSQNIFEEDIITVCAAIFLHNLDDKCFESKKIDIKKAKLAYLLKLSDEIQDWNRTVFKNNRSNPSMRYDLNVIDKRLELKTIGNFEGKIGKYLSPQDLIANKGKDKGKTKGQKERQREKTKGKRQREKDKGKRQRDRDLSAGEK